MGKFNIIGSMSIFIQIFSSKFTRKYYRKTHLNCCKFCAQKLNCKIIWPGDTTHREYHKYHRNIIRNFNLQILLKINEFGKTT